MYLRIAHLFVGAMTASLYLLVDVPVSMVARKRLDHEDLGPVEW